MTDRVKGITVSLEQDVRTDDIEPILDAIRQLRGVADVEVVLSDMNDWMARSRVRSEISGKLLEVYESILKKS